MGRHELPDGLEKGAIIAGKYRVDRVVGAGGMAVVVAATHTELGEKVALKIMLPVLAEDPALVTRFRREAKAASSVRSEHVVQVRDVDLLPTGEPFIVMELLEGRDLEQLTRRGHLADGDLVAYAVQACLGLADAHARGIIHRDVKPGNLFLTRDDHGEPVVKVVDFGISRVRDEAALTSVGHVVGSLGYMPPEQLGAVADLDERADVYALAVTLYELLSRTRAYGGPSIIEVSERIIAGDAPDLATLRPDLPAELTTLVMAAMHRHRDRRPRTILELALGLAPFASSHADDAVAKLRRRARGSAPSLDGVAPTAPPAADQAEPAGAEPRSTPEVPAPEVPAPEVPAPEVPAPEVPAPEVPAPEAPAPEALRQEAPARVRVDEPAAPVAMVEPAASRPTRRRLAIQIAGLVTGAALAVAITLLARIIVGGATGP